MEFRKIGCQTIKRTTTEFFSIVAKCHLFIRAKLNKTDLYNNFRHTVCNDRSPLELAMSQKLCWKLNSDPLHKTGVLHRCITHFDY